MPTNNPYRIPPRIAGFTLAELIVAAAIGSLAILVLVGVLRKGIEISETTQHRQRARAIIDSCLESQTYQPQNYAAIPASKIAAVIIDPRYSGTTDDLVGTLSIAVTADVKSLGQDVVRDNVSCKRIQLTVSWAEPQGAENVSIEKTITKDLEW